HPAARGTSESYTLSLHDALPTSNGDWTSARIETNRQDFRPPPGGVMRIEGRLRLPAVTGNAALGYWPAFWALNSPYRSSFDNWRSEEHTSELQSRENLVCRLLLE